MVEATTLGAASATAPSQPGLVSVKAAQSSAVSALKATLESPKNGQVGSGLTVIRGWTFAAAGRAIRRVQLIVDGALGPTIPCCSERGDVAAAFPGEPNARNSGFGLTFNYGVLASGVHTIAVEIEDSAGETRTLTAGVVVKRPGEFEFLMVADNIVTNSGSGIELLGGFEASNNTFIGEIRGNEVQDSAGSGIDLRGGWFASGNMADAMVVDNTVTNSRGDGIHVYGGTTQPQENIEGTARNNVFTGMILRNKVQSSTETDIAVFGGFDDSNGPVVGNLAKQDIIGNVAKSIQCADGIPGNKAECTFSGNTGASNTIATSESSSQWQGQSSNALQKPAPPALPLIERLTSRAEELRARAQTEQDTRIQAELLKIANRLDALKDKVAARAVGQE